MIQDMAGSPCLLGTHTRVCHKGDGVILDMQGLSGGTGSMTQHITGSPLPSPRLTSPGARQPLKPLVHSRTVLQETMREVSFSPISVEVLLCFLARLPVLK